MGKPLHKWIPLYEYLRDLPPGSFVSWETASKLADQHMKTSRGSIRSAREHLECWDGMTISGQSAEGFLVVRQEQA